VGKGWTVEYNIGKQFAIQGPALERRALAIQGLGFERTLSVLGWRDSRLACHADFSCGLANDSGFSDFAREFAAHFIRI
jgi:hypothetical protein